MSFTTCTLSHNGLIPSWSSLALWKHLLCSSFSHGWARLYGMFNCSLNVTISPENFASQRLLRKSERAFPDLSDPDRTRISLLGPVTGPGGKKKKCYITQAVMAVLWTADQVQLYLEEVLWSLLAADLLHCGSTTVTLHQTI